MESKSIRILKRRKSLGLTQAELAIKVGVSRVAVGNWESDPDVEIGGEKLLNLSEALQMSPHKIIFGLDKKTLPPDPEKPINTILNALFDLVIAGDIKFRKGADPKESANYIYKKIFDIETDDQINTLTEKSGTFNQ
jgi:transcriptional regulator with XRE-family HTH domain